MASFMISCFQRPSHDEIKVVYDLNDITSLHRALIYLQYEEQKLKYYNMEFENRRFPSSKYIGHKTGLEHISEKQLKQARKRWYSIITHISIIRSKKF